MLANKKLRLMVSLASLPASCFMAGSLFAQVGAYQDAISRAFNAEPDIEASSLPVTPKPVPSLPVPPRKLPDFRPQDQSAPLEGQGFDGNNPFSNQFEQAYSHQSTSPKIERPSEPTTLENWQQPIDDSAPVIGQDFSGSKWIPPSVDPPTATEPVRVAELNKTGKKLNSSSLKLELGKNIAGEDFVLDESGGAADWVPPSVDPPIAEEPVRVAKLSKVGKKLEPSNSKLSTLNYALAKDPSVMDLGLGESGGIQSSTEGDFEGDIPSLKLPSTESQPAIPIVVSTAPPSLIVPNLGKAESIDRKIESAPQVNRRNDSFVWWKKQILSPTTPGSVLQPVETNSLVFSMLKKSPRLRAVSQNPLIREQQIVEAESTFDPVAFLRSQFEDRVDPVGDTLEVTADGTDFLNDNIWTADLGIRRKTISGASVELNQRLGFRNSNSNVFLPQDQGTATLALNVTQPLLRGRGEYFNRSQILIAQAATNASWDTLSVELQNEIQSVVDSYWRLYFDRCVFLQKEKNVERAQAVLEKLEGRSGLDSLPNQIARARSAVLSRKTELANARRDIRNSETDIRRLTADSNWAASQMIELLPAELPDLAIPVVDLEQVILTAIDNRPEISEAIKRSKVAAIQRDISVNELLPELSLLLGTYVSALQGESQLGEAFIDQFGSVTPGYSVGVEFEMPIRNRAARSRLTQRKLQMNLIKAEIEETMQNVVAESQIARRRVVSAKETLVAAIEAILAATLDLEQNEGRWESFALIEGDLIEGQSPTAVLEQLLDSQERLAVAELVYAQAEMELKVSEIALQRTMGTLLTHRSVNFSRGFNEGTPTVDFSNGQ